MVDTVANDIPTAVSQAVAAFNAAGFVDFPPFRFYFNSSDIPPGAKLLVVPPQGPGPYMVVSPLPGYEDAALPPAVVPTPGYAYLGSNHNSWQINERYLMPIGSTPPGDSFLIDPCMPWPNTGRLLLLKKAYLTVPGFPVPEPVFDPSIGEGEETAAGIRKIAILFDIVPVPNAPATFKKWTGGFTFLSNEANWVCLSTSSTPAGGQQTLEISVGCSTYDYQRFHDERNITVSVDAGVIASILSFGMDIDMTHDMSMTLIHSETHSSQTTSTIEVDFPDSDLTQFWQGQSNLVLYNSQGEIVDSAPTQTISTRLTYQKQGAAAISAPSGDPVL